MTDGFVTNLDPLLEQQVFDSPERKRKADVHHDHQADLPLRGKLEKLLMELGQRRRKLGSLASNQTRLAGKSITNLVCVSQSRPRMTAGCPATPKASNMGRSATRTGTSVSVRLPSWPLGMRALPVLTEALVAP
jgi:hypothetical protein